MSSALPAELLNQLTPLLGSLARLVARGTPLNETQLRTLLLSVGLEDDSAALQELALWGRLLTALREHPSEASRHATVEALLVRGLPEAAAILAVSEVACAGAQQPFPLTQRLQTSVTRLDLGILQPGQGATAEFEVQGGPGQIVAESDQVQVTPQQFGPDRTHVRVEVRPMQSGVLWTTLRLVTVGETVEVPVVAQWQDVQAPSPPVSQPPVSGKRRRMPAWGLLLITPLLSALLLCGVIIGWGLWQQRQEIRQAEATATARAEAAAMVQAEATATARAEATATARAEAAATVQAEATATARAEAAATVQAEATATAQVFALPVAAGTPVPRSANVILPVNVHELKELARWDKAIVNAIAWSPDGNLLAVASSLGVYVIDARTLREVHFLETNAWQTSVAFSPDGTLLASGSSTDHTVRLWRVSDSTLLRTLQGHASGIWSVAFSPDGALLVSGSADGTVRLWQVSDGSFLGALEEPGEVWSVAFSPDGTRLATGTTHAMRLWRISDRTLKAEKRHHLAVRSVAFSPDGALLASGGDDDFVRLWRSDDGATAFEFGGLYSSGIWSLAFSPSGTLLAAGATEGIVHLFQVSNRNRLNSPVRHVDVVRSVAFSPDGTLLASGSADHTVRLWGVWP